MADVEERAWLVEKEHLRLLHQCARDRDALLLAAAERVGGALRERDEVAALEGLGDDDLIALGRTHPCTLMRRAPHRDHLADREAHRELLLLLDDGQAARDLGPRQRGDVAPEELHVTRGDPEHPGGDSDEGGLSGPVRSEDTDELARSDDQVDVVQLALGRRVG